MAKWKEPALIDPIREADEWGAIDALENYQLDGDKAIVSRYAVDQCVAAMRAALAGAQE